MRQLGDPLPWDYEREARAALSASHRAIDLGTGGGEVLARLSIHPHGSIVAAEQWGPNAHLATKRLLPHGIPLVWCVAEGTRLPFRDSSFDLCLDRHEALTPSEVDRVLVPGGTLLTQQVTSQTMRELKRYIPRATTFSNHDDEYPDAFTELGYRVAVRRHRFRVAFPGIARLVQFLVVAPWTVPDFSVERDIDALIAIERDLTTSDGIVFNDGRYLLQATKPTA